MHYGAYITHAYLYAHSKYFRKYIIFYGCLNTKLLVNVWDNRHHFHSLLSRLVFACLCVGQQFRMIIDISLNTCIMHQTIHPLNIIDLHIEFDASPFYCYYLECANKLYLMASAQKQDTFLLGAKIAQNFAQQTFLLLLPRPLHISSESPIARSTFTPLHLVFEIAGSITESNIAWFGWMSIQILNLFSIGSNHIELVTYAMYETEDIGEQKVISFNCFKAYDFIPLPMASISHCFNAFANQNASPDFCFAHGI